VSHTSVHVIDGSVRESSTRAAADYVRMVRGRLRAEVERAGPQVKQTRSYQRLERGIEPEVLRKTWPEANMNAVLKPD
jgi:hypothetical protein